MLIILDPFAAFIVTKGGGLNRRFTCMNECTHLSCVLLQRHVLPICLSIPVCKSTHEIGQSTVFGYNHSSSAYYLNQYLIFLIICFLNASFSYRLNHITNEVSLPSVFQTKYLHLMYTTLCEATYLEQFQIISVNIFKFNLCTFRFPDVIIII